MNTGPFKRFVVLLFLFNVIEPLHGVGNAVGIFIAEDTKWCGGGNRAETCLDLGVHNETDACCREHDMCPYTFSYTNDKHGDNYNGFAHNNVKPLSHCECDLMFSDCLKAEPYKKGSYYIYESYYEELSMFCFAYLPCPIGPQDPGEYGNIWEMKKSRRTGECHEGLRVVEFDSIFDYSEFMKSQVTKSQKELLRNVLETRAQSFMSVSKKEHQCLEHFAYFPSALASGFEKRFLVTQQAAHTPVLSVETAPTSITGIIADKETNADNYLILFGYTLESENMVVVLVSVVLLVTGIMLSIVLVSFKVYQSLNKYISIKANSSAADLISAERML